MAKAIVLQPRDWEVLRGLLEARVMCARHVAELYFPGRREMAKKRMQKLKAAGLVGEYRREPTEPAILRLMPAGLRLLESEGILGLYPPMPMDAHARRLRVSGSRMRHEIAVMDALTGAVREARAGRAHDAVGFCAWPDLIAIPGETVRKPDAAVFVRTTAGRRQTIYIEADRSTESLAVILGKVCDYTECPEGVEVLFVFETEARWRSVEASIRRMVPSAIGRVRFVIGSRAKRRQAAADGA